MKKKYYSLVSVAVTIALLISLLVVPAGAAESSDGISDANQVRLLSALGIQTKISDAAVTRGEFASYIVNAVGKDSITPSGKLPYEDVAPEDSYYAAVGILYDIGVLSESTHFNPARAISAYEAAKIIVSVLGFDYIAAARGGYPGGYLQCINDMDISLDVGMSITHTDMPAIIYDMLCVSPNHSFVDDQLISTKDPNGFLVYHNVSFVCGTVTSNAISSIYSDVSETSSGYITLDGKKYKAAQSLTDGKKGLSECLGCRVAAYVYDYEGKNEEIIYFDTSSAKIVEFNMRDVSKNGVTITHSEGEKDKKYNLSTGYSVLWNGKLCDDFRDADFQSLDGKLVLYDNNEDSRYDIISVEKPEYIISEGINALYKSVADKNKHTYGNNNLITISFDDNDCIYEYFMHTDSGLVACSFEDLESFSVFSIVMSKDNKYIRLTGLDGVVSGTVTEAAEGEGGEVAIDGVLYEKTEYFNEHNLYIPISSYVTAYLTETGRIIYIESGENVMRYGYLMKIGATGSWGEYSAAFLFEDGRKENVAFGKKLVLDGESVSPDFDNTSSNAYIKLFDKPQVVKYSLDKEGKFSAIDTATDAPSPESLYTQAPNDNPKDSLLRYTDESTVSKKVISYTTTLLPVIVPRSVKIFSVPEILRTDAASYDFDIDDFDIATLAEIPTSQIQVEVFDIARNRDAGALVWYNENAGGGSLPALGERATPAIIDRIVDAIDEDGNHVKKVTYITQSGNGLTPNYATALFSVELQAYYDRQGYDLRAGDLVAIAPSGDRIANIKPRISMQSWKIVDADAKYLYSDYKTQPLDFLCKGTLLDVADSVLTVLLDDDDPNDGYDNRKILSFPTFGLSMLMRFNHGTGTFEKVNIDELKTAFNSGMENADRLLAKCLDTTPTCIGIYPQLQK